MPNGIHQVDCRESGSTLKKIETFSPLKATPVKQAIVEEEFPTLNLIGSHSMKKAAYLDDTESSRQLLSENTKEKDIETSLSNLSSLDRMILKKLKTSCGLTSRRSF